ncbi:CoB--CoM heterodisulfide reductase iron-sulfur subunit B family protein [Desulfofundulus sp.]|uniref:CoB--CoM heterodisulfide reductase iron-sulfur subunit B family protein n=1 Tax=Desulfofundulus sp. TaxID=2282750 RepID=UPI003C73D946
MRIPYFPGCTLHSKAKGLDDSTRGSLAALGVELNELSQWTCCGTVFPLAQDNYIGMVAAARILANAAREGGGKLVTVCSFCYHVLKRVNNVIKNNLEARRKLNDYLEENYTGDIRPVHPLEICKEDVGFDTIRNKVTRSLDGLKVACYYGCMLVRPASEMNFDDPENPTIMEELVSALGAEVIEYPNKTTCCGSYQILHDNALVMQKVEEILQSATNRGAEAIVTSCPLCQFNLDWFQKKILQKKNSFKTIPVLYFTQLLGLALELPQEKLGLEQHYVDPRPLLVGA